MGLLKPKNKTEEALVLLNDSFLNKSDDELIEAYRANKKKEKRG